MPSLKTAPPMTLTTPLGKDVLLFRSMQASEELGRLFEFDVRALADHADIKAADLLGKVAAVGLEQPDGSQRHFHGLVCAMGADAPFKDMAGYRLVLRPWLWLLTRRADHRVFQHKSVTDIAKDVFQPFGGEFRFDVSRTPPPYEYCLQYHETDFDFVSRLFEQEGLYYFFEHTAAKHTLVVVDDPGKHKPCRGGSRLRYRESAGAMLDEEAVTAWAGVNELHSGAWKMVDYDFERPSTSLLAEANSKLGGAKSELEVYEYPGPYLDKGLGEDYARLRSEQADSRHARFSGSGAVRSLACGGTFDLLEHPIEGQDGSYLTLATHIEMGLGGYESGSGDDRFHCRFVAAPAAVPYRSPLRTPKPRSMGPQTAVVVGPEGDEIHTDEHGRVKIQFHWDRHGKSDADSSCFVRVAQPAAGNGWGQIWLPRIGQEVVVDFIDGDLDRPLITGRVYNGEQLPPYELPANASVSTFKSRSIGGGADDFNELRFEDKGGEEYLFMQAQKDRLELVKDSSRSEIRNEEHRTVGSDRKEKVDGEWHLTVGKDVKQKFGVSLHSQTGQDMLLDAGGKHSLEAGTDITAKAGTAYSIEAGTDLHAKAGQNVGLQGGVNVHVKGGVNVVIEAAVTLTLKGGAGSVVVGPDGVSITGPLVKINSGGAPGSGSGASPVAPTRPDDPVEPELPEDPLEHR